MIDFTDYPKGIARLNFLKDNADSQEELNYFKKFTEPEIVEKKSDLSDLSININDIEVEKKAVDSVFKQRLKPLNDKKAVILQDLKHRGRSIKEVCFKFIDYVEKVAVYYNQDGEMIETRPLNPNEMQKTIFSDMRNTGTND